jgi:hypothetical protein
MSFVVEMFKFMRARKKFWMLPIIAVCVVLGGVLVLAQG